MTESVAPNYGFEVTEVPEGHRVSYQRTEAGSGAKVKIGCLLAGVGGLCLVLLAFLPFCAIFEIPIIAFLGYKVYRRYKRRIEHPTSFLITKDHIVIGQNRFDRKHVSKVYVADPAGNEVYAYSSSSGGYVMGGTGMAGAGLAGVNAASGAMMSSARQFGASLNRDLQAISAQIRFEYGEEDVLLANGLSPARARALLDAVMKSMSKGSTP